jgi:peroxiredoxin
MKLSAMILAVMVMIPASAPAYEIGDTPADFTLPDLTGNDVALYDHQGDIIVLNFFTTWCPGCNEEADHLENDIWNIYRDQGVTVIAVDIMEFPSLVQGWAAALGVTYEILMAPDWTLFEQYPSAGGLPYNAILDRKMVIRYGSLGFDLDAVTGMIQTILDEDQVPVTGETWGGIKALFY